VDSVLIVKSTDKGKTLLVDLLKNQTFSQVTTVDLGSEARRLFIENSFDLVIINTPLADEFGHELAQMITESTMTGVIMIVKSELADEISAKVEEFACLWFRNPSAAKCLPASEAGRGVPAGESSGSGTKI
jgi:response regulator NasT